LRSFTSTSVDPPTRITATPPACSVTKLQMHATVVSTTILRYAVYNLNAILVARMAWIVETLDAVVDEEVAALPADMRAHLSRISLMIEEFGLERMREPHVKHLRGPLWKCVCMAETGYRGRYTSLLVGSVWSLCEPL
jgi:hypothetical protein